MFFAAEAVDPQMVSPGAVGFMATLFVGVVTTFLIFDMVRRIRRSRYREEIRAKLDAEVAAEAQAAPASE
jgi:hypothetical protein